MIQTCVLAVACVVAFTLLGMVWHVLLTATREIERGER
jgi:hypothetical protein